MIKKLRRVWWVLLDRILTAKIKQYEAPLERRNLPKDLYHSYVVGDFDQKAGIIQVNGIIEAGRSFRVVRTGEKLRIRNHGPIRKITTYGGPGAKWNRESFKWEDPCHVEYGMAIGLGGWCKVLRGTGTSPAMHLIDGDLLIAERGY